MSKQLLKNMHELIKTHGAMTEMQIMQHFQLNDTISVNKDILLSARKLMYRGKIQQQYNIIGEKVYVCRERTLQ